MGKFVRGLMSGIILNPEIVVAILGMAMAITPEGTGFYNIVFAFGKRDRNY